jgi:hypothetical protein
MTQLLLASVRLWTGRTEDAVGLASEALGAFEQIADPYGRGQASAVLGRAMTMHGRVEEGLDLLHRAGNPPGMERGRGPASGQMARMALFATAIQIGQPELVDDVVGELAEIASAGSGEATVALGMHALQHGDVALAAAHLFRDETEAPSANLGAVRALVAALSGRDDVESLAHVALARDGVTYLDRAVVGTARAVAAIRASARTDPVDVARLRREAHSTMRGVLAEIDGTGDEVAAAVFRLVAARVGEALADPDPVVTPAEAEAGLARLGVDASGWRRILDLASAPAPV